MAGEPDVNPSTNHTHDVQYDLKKEEDKMATCDCGFGEECRLHNFGLSDVDPHLMVQSKWPFFTQGRFLIYRVFMATLVTSLTVINFWREYELYHQPWVWFSWATNWGIMAMTLVLWTHAFYAAIYYMDAGKLIEDERMPVCLMTAWALYNAAASSAFVITGCFWVYLFGIDPSPIFDIPDSQAKHVINTVVVLVDLSISAIPIRILHFIYAITFAIIYSLFSYLYYLFEGPLMKNQKAIYSVLNWNRPQIAILFVLMNIALLIVSQTALYLIHRLRLLLQKHLPSCTREYTPIS